MNENMTGSDWVAARGQKWLAQLDGMEAMLAPIDEPLIGALNLELSTPLRIADIGCGGGGTAMEIVRLVAKGSAVHGFDLSPAIVDVARSRMRPGDSENIFNVADVGMVLPQEPYDRLVSRFGIMFFDNPSGAFSNLAGWLVPGGRFAFAVWGPLSENPWMGCVREVVAGIVALGPHDPGAPGPFRYGGVEKLTSLLEASGFEGIAVSEWRGSLAIGGGLSAAEAANFALASFSTFGELLAGAGRGALDEARKRLTEDFAAHQYEGVVAMNACVHLVTGVRTGQDALGQQNPDW